MLHTSRKFWRCVFASSCGFPLNLLACNIRISDGWISKLISPISACSPNEILVAEGDEKSAMGWLTIDILIFGAELPSLSEFKCELGLWWWTRRSLEFLRDLSESANVVALNWKSLIHYLVSQWRETQAGVDCLQLVDSKLMIFYQICSCYKFLGYAVPGNDARNACWQILTHTG